MHAADPNVQVGFPYPLPRNVAAGTGTWVADTERLEQRRSLAADKDQVPVRRRPLVSDLRHPAPGQRPALRDGRPRSRARRRACATRLDKYDPSANIIAGEGNISQSEIVNNAWPVSALFASASALTFLSHGAETYQWWQVHNSDNLNGDFGFLSDGTGTAGVGNTTLTAPATVGSRVIDTANTTNFHTQHSLTIGGETRKITALPGSTTLVAGTAAGDTNVKVAAEFALTTSGATTDYHWFFAPGTRITVGSGDSAETRTVVKTGTAASTTALAAPAAAGDTNVKIVGGPMGGQNIAVFMPPGLAPGGKVTIGTGDSAETSDDQERRQLLEPRHEPGRAREPR